MWSAGDGKVRACAISMAAWAFLPAVSGTPRAQTQVASLPLRVDGLYRAVVEKDYLFYRFYSN